MAMIDMFLNDAQDLNDGKIALPQVVIVNFSFALMHTILLVFNRCTLSQYLQSMWNHLKAQKQSMPFTQVINPCCTHLLKEAASQMCSHFHLLPCYYAQKLYVISCFCQNFSNRFMAALRSRCRHYILVLWFLLSIFSLFLA